MNDKEICLNVWDMVINEYVFMCCIGVELVIEIDVL